MLEEINMKKYETIELNGERIYLRKNFLGWNVIYPSRIDGKINWKNFLAGKSWWNLLFVGIIVVLILGCVKEYSHAVIVANNCLEKLNLARIRIIP